MIDLHFHSTASDGTLTPTQLVETAALNNIRAVALTDHDTTEGIGEFMAAGEKHGIETIPGIELSSSWYSSAMHIVGLYIDPQNKALNTFLKQVIDNRNIRNAKIITKLQELDYEVTLKEWTDEAGGDVIGRPHMASLLVKKGYFNNNQEVFEALLATNRKAFVPRYLPKPSEAIKIIQNAGGVAIWAHPYAMRNVPYSVVRKTGTILKSSGLDGIECYYSHFSESEQRNANKFADTYKMLKSGGSDFHGDNSPGVSLGSGKGTLNVPYECLDKIKKLHQKRVACATP